MKIKFYPIEATPPGGQGIRDYGTLSLRDGVTISEWNRYQLIGLMCEMHKFAQLRPALFWLCMRHGEVVGKLVEICPESRRAVLRPEWTAKDINKMIALPAGYAYRNSLIKMSTTSAKRKFREIARICMKNNGD